MTLRLVARHAQMWNSIAPNATEGGRLNDVIDHWCEVEGTDPASIERTALVPATADVSEWEANGFSHLIAFCGHPFDLSTLEPLLAQRK